MKLKNTSKSFTTAQIREMINFTRPARISNFDIWIKSSGQAWGGRCYYKGCSFHKSFAPYVVIRINPKYLHFPLYYRPRQAGYLKWSAFTSEEVLVYLLAHELRHLWQAKIKRGWRVWGSRGQFSERDADAYAIHKVREWRRVINTNN